MTQEKQEKQYQSKNNNIINKYRSKILHLWSFVLNGTFHRIEFFDSKISGKKKLILDANILLSLDKRPSGKFQYNFKLDKSLFTVYQLNDSYDLKIDNRSFSDIMQDERTGVLRRRKEEAEKKKLIQIIINLLNQIEITVIIFSMMMKDLTFLEDILIVIIIINLFLFIKLMKNIQVNQIVC